MLYCAYIPPLLSVDLFKYKITKVLSSSNINPETTLSPNLLKVI